MAKIILNTSLINDTYLVEYKSIETVKGRKLPTNAELVITPKNDYVINAVDFSCGLLPKEIKDIKFANTNKVVNSKNRIIVKVFFNSITVSKEYTLIYLPLSGSSILAINNFELTEKIRLDDKVFVKEENNYQIKTTVDNNTKTTIHTVKGVPNEKVKILSKEFTLPDGYHFVVKPSFKISGQKGMYSSTLRYSRNDTNKIIGATIDLYCTFPSFEFKDLIKDTVSFDYNSQKIPISTIEESKEIGQKIYGMDTGPIMSSAGGEKRISVRGNPGSTFKLIIQNSAKEIYDFKTGLFSDGAVALEGVIPPILKGAAFGEYRNIIKVPRNTGTRESIIKTTLISDDQVDHGEIRRNYDASVVTKPEDKIMVSPIEDKTEQLGKIKIKVFDGGNSAFQIYRTLLKTDVPVAATLYELDGIKYLKDGFYEVGASEGTAAGSSIEEAIANNPIETIYGKAKQFTFVIKTDSSFKYIRTHRLALFDQEQDYTRWDSAYGSETNKKHTSDGEEVKMDWGTSVRHSVTSDGITGTTIDFLNSKIKMNVAIKGFGGAVEHGVSIESGESLRTDAADMEEAYNAVVLTIGISGTFGEGEVVPELNLNNFLSIYNNLGD